MQPWRKNDKNKEENMTNRFKDFGAGKEVTSEPVTFKLHDEEFECYPAMQGKVLLDLVANSNEDDGAAIARTIDKFFAVTLLPESYIRFTALLEDPLRIVSVDTLGEITGWLVEEYAGRPNQEPEVS